MKVSIGKDTLGGGKKMTTRLNNYNRSTHDLSFICRTTAAPGVLQPTMVLLALPGDTFDIDIRSHILTHPTIGPLFGSFKVQNDFFFCPIRLYQALLHNNMLNIGLNMSTVKFPVVSVLPRLWTDTSEMPGSNGSLPNLVHPSSLLFHLGYKNLRSYGDGNNKTEINVIKPMMYYDIFKNYYANKQEKSFYTIGAKGFYQYANKLNKMRNAGFFTFTIMALIKNTNKYILIEPPEMNKEGASVNIDFNDEAMTSISPVIVISPQNLEDKVGNAIISLSWEKIISVPGSEQGSQIKRYSIQGEINELLVKGVLKKINTENITSVIEGEEYYQLANHITGSSTPVSVNYSYKIQFNVRQSVVNDLNRYESYPLTDIDDMRENILKSGREQYISNDLFILNLFNNLTKSGGVNINSSEPMVGLALKTYQSDININWVNTEWIDGDTGINAITAIDTSSGSFTLDTLNLAKKVYTMLNRIAVSDGSYNAWIQTVYTSGGLNHIETPIYLGGSSLEIEFQEVINNSGTEDQPLGSLAGRGVTSDHKGGKIKFKADEPGYLFCITSITPRVDYFQGDEWDNYLKNLDELHKPQLDGIGFQDRLYKNINSATSKESWNKSIGKQPAWIDYMTNVNKTFGNFALIENEGWMCLNRIFGDIDTYTTYVQPHLYNNIFADTDVTAQNFWVQIAFNIKARRVMSAKVIPNV